MSDETTVTVDNTEVVDTVEAVEDTSVDTPVAEAPEASAPEETVEDIFTSIDDLLALTSEDYEEFAPDANHTGMKPLHEWMKHVPADVRKHIANLRGSYTKKTQEIAAMRKELEAERAALRTNNQNILNGSLAKKVAEVDTEANYDLFDPEGMQKEIQRQAALMMQEMLKPAQEELQLQQRRVELQAFKDANPELNDPSYKKEVADMLRARPELSLEDAFYITKAKLGQTEALRLQKEKEALRASRRATARQSSTGSRASVSKAPKFKNAMEAYKWHKANSH